METNGEKRRIVPNGLNWADYVHPDDLKYIEAILKVKNLKKAYYKIQKDTPKYKTFNLARFIKVTEAAFSEIFKLTKLASELLNVSLPDVYITSDPYINAFAFGVDENQYIVLNSGLIEKMTHDELLHIIGHEMGHIQCEWNQRF